MTEVLEEPMLKRPRLASMGERDSTENEQDDDFLKELDDMGGKLAPPSRVGESQMASSVPSFSSPSASLSASSNSSSVGKQPLSNGPPSMANGKSPAPSRVPSSGGPPSGAGVPTPSSAGGSVLQDLLLTPSSSSAAVQSQSSLESVGPRSVPQQQTGPPPMGQGGPPLAGSPQQRPPTAPSYPNRSPAGMLSPPPNFPQQQQQQRMVPSMAGPPQAMRPPGSQNYFDVNGQPMNIQQQQQQQQGPYVSMAASMPYGAPPGRTSHPQQQGPHMMQTAGGALPGAGPMRHPRPAMPHGQLQNMSGQRLRPQFPPGNGAMGGRQAILSNGLGPGGQFDPSSPGGGGQQFGGPPGSVPLMQNGARNMGPGPYQMTRTVSMDGSQGTLMGPPPHMQQVPTHQLQHAASFGSAPPQPPPPQIMSQQVPPQMSQNGPLATASGPPGGPKIPYANGPVQMDFSSPNLSAGIEGVVANGPIRPGPPGGPQGGGGGQNDPEKRKLIQQQLVLLLHAHKCQQRDKEALGQGRPPPHCELLHCATMKAVLAHMTTCQANRNCQFAHCASSRQIISHWKNCTRDDCPVCKPLKNVQEIGGSGPPLGGVSNLRLPGPLGAAEVPQNQGPPILGFSAQSAAGQFHGGQRQPLAGGPFGPGGPQAGGGIPIPGTMPNGPLIQQGLMASRMPNGPENFRLPPPGSPTTNKEWHQAVTKDLRNHLVTKLVKAIFPSPDPAAMHDQRIRDLIQYARKVEKEMFEQANDREEYYHLLAEKIYKIQKELQEKKQRRQLQEQQRFQQQQQNGVDLGQQLNNLDSQPPPNRALPPPTNPSAFGGPSAGPLYPPSTSTGLGNLPGSSSQLMGPTVNVKLEIDPGGPMIKTEPIDGTPGGGPKGRGSEDVKPNPADLKVSKSEACLSVKAGRKDASTVSKKVPVREKKFLLDELRDAFLPVWDKIERLDEAIPFRVPVDPELLHIPDYFDIIKEPMDLSTIKDKLLRGDYATPWDFCKDIYLMFDNAWLYNRKNSKVYKLCNKVYEVFKEEVDPVMQKLGYCCGRRLPYTPLPYVCYGNTQSNCVIQRDQTYFLYEHNISSKFSTTNYTEKYTYCARCFEALPDKGINLSEDPNAPKWVPKTEFRQSKNDQLEFEPFETCQCCRREWHRICALHSDKIYRDGFICVHCRHEWNIKLAENRFTASRLPHCSLSRHIETRVNNYLQRKQAAAGDVYVRVLSSSDKEVDVKTMMTKRYEEESFPKKFPYRSKAIFAFEVIDGNEVCFFGLHVQEYGTNAPKPNARRVYIAYLDSVHFFQPRSERTNVYHEILLGYLEYVRQLGYTMAHIWACPPQEGDDYVFHCHPPEQKIPKQKRLQEWYKKMLDKGIIERTVTDYKDIHAQALSDNLQTLTDLPYFEGDFWPTIFEDIIRDVEKAELERKREEEEAVQSGGLEVPGVAGLGLGSAFGGELDDDDLYDNGCQGKSKSKSVKATNKKKNAKNKGCKNRKKPLPGSGNEIVDKLYTHLEKHKEVFFTIRLTSAQTETTMQREIRDPDPLISSDLMDGRDSFLAKSREEHWEFSSLRRAKYSTMCLCHALHEQGAEAGFSCDKCRANAKWHCTVCESYDLCAACQQQNPHEHPMTEVQNVMDAEPAPAGGAHGGQGRTAQQDINSRTESIQRCIQSLVHACQCRDANCRRLSCHKMKRVVQHTRNCNKRKSGSCPVCKQLIALCCYHSKHCNDNSCAVPFCTSIQLKLKEQKQAQRRQADQMMRRRMNAVYQPAAPPVVPAAPQVAPQGAPSPFGGPTQSMMGAARMAGAGLQGTPTGHPYGGVGQQAMMCQPSSSNAYSPIQQQQQHYVQQGRMPAGGGGKPPPYSRQQQQAQQQQQQPMWSEGDPRLQQQQQQQQQQQADVRRYSSQTDVRSNLDNLLQKFRAANGHEEQKKVIDSVKHSPQLLTCFLKMIKESSSAQQQHMRQQQQQQQMGSPACMGGPSGGPWKGNGPPQAMGQQGPPFFGQGPSGVGPMTPPGQQRMAAPPTYVSHLQQQQQYGAAQGPPNPGAVPYTQQAQQHFGQQKDVFR